MFELDKAGLLARMKSVLQQAKNKGSELYLKAQEFLKTLEESINKMVEDDFLTAFNYWQYYLEPRIC
jgi:CRISPR/Cas system CSM-associated protein Csm2 small subunit